MNLLSCSRGQRPRLSLLFRAAGRCAVEVLEPRRLFAVQLAQPIPNEALKQGNAVFLDLRQIFFDPQSFFPDISYTVSTDTPTVVTPSVSGSLLSLRTSSTRSGFARVTVIASDVNGNRVNDTFRVEVDGSPSRSGDLVLGAGGKRSFRYVTSNRTSAVISLAGPGTATLHVSGDLTEKTGNRIRGTNEVVESITLKGTTSATALRITGHPRLTIAHRTLQTLFPDVGNISTTGSFAIVNIINTTLAGDLSVAGSVRTMRITSAQNGAITIGKSSKQMILETGALADENFTSATPLRHLVASGWVNSGSVPSTFSAPYVHNLVVFGSFMPGLQLSGRGPSGRSLDETFVGGFIDGTWNIAGSSNPLLVGATAPTWNATFASLSKMTVRGIFGGSLTAPSLQRLVVQSLGMSRAVLNLTAPYAPGRTNLGTLIVRGNVFESFIQSAGNIGVISVQGLQRSAIFAGVGMLAQGQSLPQSASDFTSPASIGAVIATPRRRLIGFAGSGIAASGLGVLSLASTQVNNGGNAFGIAAHHIGRITVFDRSHRQFINLAGINNPTTLAAEIAAKNLKLQDFAIKVI